jgi:hypothetical protein
MAYATIPTSISCKSSSNIQQPCIINLYIFELLQYIILNGVNFIAVKVTVLNGILLRYRGMQKFHEHKNWFFVIVLPYLCNTKSNMNIGYSIVIAK